MTQRETWTVPPGMQVADPTTGAYGPVAPGGGGALTVLKKGTAYTLTAADSGKLVVPTANDVVLTLPVAAAGLHYTIVPWTDWAHPVKVRPHTGEQIAALGERTLAAGVGVIGDGFTLGVNAMAAAGPLEIYATGAGEPWVVAGVAGNTGSGIGWSSES